MIKLREERLEVSICPNCGGVLVDGTCACGVVIMDTCPICGGVVWGYNDPGIDMGHQSCITCEYCCNDGMYWEDLEDCVHPIHIWLTIDGTVYGYSHIEYALNFLGKVDKDFRKTVIGEGFTGGALNYEGLMEFEKEYYKQKDLNSVEEAFPIGCDEDCDCPFCSID